MSNLEARLAHAEGRLSSVDGKPEPRRPKMVRTVEKIAPVPAEATPGKDSAVKPPSGRELPRPADRVFPESSSWKRRYGTDDNDRGSVRRRRRDDTVDEDDSIPDDSLRRKRKRRDH